MNMFVALICLIVGFVLLVKGADFFVDGASAIAKQLHIPAIVIGLTIVAFGTSAPELAVSISAAMKGSNDIAVGNVVGSNLFNLLIVVGVSAFIYPLHVKKSMIKKDYPIALIGAVLLGVLAMDTLFGKTSMELSRADGVILLIGFTIFMYLAIREGLKGRAEHKENEEKIEVQYTLGKSIFICIIGLAGIIIGGNMVVDGAKEIARAFGLSEAFIGLTIVAFGTSLPELVTSIVAARKGESDISLGNVIGSNIFNIFFILGVSGTILPMAVANTYLYDIAILIVVSIIFFIPICKKQKVSRAMGGTMVATYMAYMVYLFVR
ncbi:calcium/sodium antiporter [Faecalimonas sp.]